VTAKKRPRKSLREPLHIPRWVLILKYIGFAYFGGVSAYLGVPRLDLTTPDGYRPVWAAVIVVASLWSLGALILGKPKVERWTVGVLVSFLFAYVYAIVNAAWSGETNYSALAAILPLVTLFPIGRFVGLLPRGRK
jgi:hypothetical protein